jgi:alkaline phosphatase D
MAEFSALDTRQYRSDQACGDGSRVDCAERLDPNRTMIGPEQERWLLDGLERSRARWNVVAQQVFMAQRDSDPGPPQRFSMDAWDGYKAGRDRLLAHVQSRRVPNPIVLTGDVHRSWVADLKANFDDPASATIGIEFVGSSISSTGDGTAENQDAVRAANPHLSSSRTSAATCAASSTRSAGAPTCGSCPTSAGPARRSRRARPSR